MNNIKAGRLIDPETEESLSDVENALAGVGIRLRESNSEFRNTADVLDEVNANWDNYSSVQKRAIAVAFSGTRQQERFLVLMENYDKALQLAAVSAESTGTASAKYEAHMESMAAKTAAFQTALYDLSDSVVDSGFAGGIVEAGTAGVSAITALVDAVGTLPTAMALITGGSFLANLKKTSVSIKEVQAALSNIGDAANLEKVAANLAGLSGKQQNAAFFSLGFDKQQKGQVQKMLDAVKAGEAFTTQQLNQIAATVDLNDVTGANILELAGLGDALKLNTILTKDDILAKLNALKVSEKYKDLTDAQKVAIDNLIDTFGKQDAAQTKASGSSAKMWLSMAKGQLIAMGISVAISLLAKGLDWLANRAEYAAEKTEEAISSFEEMKTEIESNTEQITSLTGRIEELRSMRDNEPGAFNETLQTELVSLERQVEVLKKKNAILRDNARIQAGNAVEALKEEITLAKQNTGPYIPDDDKQIYAGQGMGFVSGGKPMGENEFIGYAREQLSMFQNIIEAEGRLTEEQEKQKDQFIEQLNEIAMRYSEWYDEAATLHVTSGDEAESIMNESYAMMNLVSDAIAQFAGAPPVIVAASRLVSEAMRDNESSVAHYRDELSKLTSSEFLQDTQTDAYKALQVFAELNNVSFDALIAELIRVGIFAEDVSESSNDTQAALVALTSATSEAAASLSEALENGISGWDEEKLKALLGHFPNLRDEINAYLTGVIDATALTKELQRAMSAFLSESLDSAYEELASAVETYGESSYQAEQAWENAIATIPGLNEVLAEQGIKFADLSLSTFESRDAFLEWIKTIAEANLAAAQLNLDNVIESMQKITRVSSVLSGLSGSITANFKTDGLKNAKEQLAEAQEFYDAVEGLFSGVSKENRKVGDKSSKSTTDAHLEEYKERVAEIEHYRNMDYISEAEYYRRLEALANEYLAGRDKYIKEYREVLEELWAYQKRLYEEQRDAQIEAIKEEAEARKEAAKAQYDAERDAAEKRKDALEDEKDAYKDLIDARKKMLDNEADERTHDQRVDELNAEIADLEAQIAALTLDDSAKARALKLELSEELMYKQRELENEQYDWSVDKQKDALDEEYERFAKLIDDQIALIDLQLDALEASYEQITNTIESTMQLTIDAINAEFDALLVRGQEVANQIQALLANINITASGGVAQMQSALVGAGYNLGNYGSNKDGVDNVFGSMTTKALQEYLNTLPTTSGQLKVDGIIGSKTRAAIDAAISAGFLNHSFDTLHSGGIVGDPSFKGDPLDYIIPLSKDEFLTKLLGGEAVLTEGQQEVLRNGFTGMATALQAERTRAMAFAAAPNYAPTVTVSNVFQGAVDSTTIRRLENWAAKFKQEIQNGVFSTMNKHSRFSGSGLMKSY